MKSLSMVAVLVLASLSLLAPIPASAFGLSGIGGRVGDVNPEGPGGNAFMVGGHLEFEQSGSRLHLQPGMMFWSKDNVQDVNPNFDLMYHFAPANKISPYVGAGAGLHVYSIDLPVGNDNHTDLGANLFGGVLIPASSLRLFGEARYVATDLSQFMIQGGVTLPFHHP